MRYYEQLYFLKDDKKSVQKQVNDFLLYQIYSVSVIRQVYPNWPAFRWFLRQNTPAEIYDLIEKSPYLSDVQLQQQLNEYQVRNAIQVLSVYQACDVPITQDPKVPQNRYKLTSKHGDRALAILKNALQKKQFSDKMANLAIRTSHKFLMEDKYYLRWKLSKKFASWLVFPVQEVDEKAWHFPTIQLTRGCMNHCSHCDSRAEPHLSHMPWPVFCCLYRKLNKYYKYYPQKTTDHYFSNFFADSDMLDYYDPFMGVDSGDVGLWIKQESGICAYLTRGVKNERNKLALAKALMSGQSIDISFVDTPKENMFYNLKQLNETLNVVETVPERKVNPLMVHLHLKKGPSVDKKVFRNFPVEQNVIYSMGRAKDFPQDEVKQIIDPLHVIPTFIFRPNGDLDFQEGKDGELYCQKGRNLFAHQHGPCISRTRLFFRRHILSHFR